MSENVFDSIGTPVETPLAPAEANRNDAKSAKLEAMKKSLKETMSTDPTFVTRLRSLSEELEVVNSLGFGENGNIVIDKAKSTAEDRVFATTSQIVGYSVKNTGDGPVNYQTEKWTKGEDGQYVPQKIEKILAPGATADLTRQFMTMFCAQPEISFQLANGKIIRGPGSAKAKGDIKSELEAFYFAFNKGINMQVNSDEFKLNVGEKDATGKWVVKPQYADTFGYLENTVEKSHGGHKAAGEKFSSTDLAANYVLSMIKANGGI